MELKEYQKRVVKRVDDYLKALAEAEKGADALRAATASLPPNVAALALAALDPGKTAWEKIGMDPAAYAAKKDGLGNGLPHFCLKIPTGGGKTLLAVESIGSAIDHWKKTAHGLVVWFVPSNQSIARRCAACKTRPTPTASGWTTSPATRRSSWRRGPPSHARSSKAASPSCF